MVIDSNFDTSGVIHDDILVKNNSSLTLHGISNGTLKISENSVVHLHGIHNGDIYVDSSCECYIHGILKGNIYNYGSIEISGIVKHCSFHGSCIKFMSNSVINGKTYHSDFILS